MFFIFCEKFVVFKFIDKVDISYGIQIANGNREFKHGSVYKMFGFSSSTNFVTTLY